MSSKTTTFLKLNYLQQISVVKKLCASANIDLFKAINVLKKENPCVIVWRNRQTVLKNWQFSLMLNQSDKVKN